VVFEARSEGPAVDVVELLGETPRIFCIADPKAAVGRDTCGGCQASEEKDISRKRVLETEKKSRKESTDKAGCMELRSVPITLADGKVLAGALHS
jgi:hypothetical protein